MQMVKMAWDLEDWEFMAVDPTVLELFPCSRQDTVSWAQVTLLSVNPTICGQEGNIVSPLLPLHPLGSEKSPCTTGCASPFPGGWNGNSQEKLVLNFTSGTWNHIMTLFLNTPQVPLPAPDPAGLWDGARALQGSRDKSMDIPGQAGS